MEFPVLISITIIIIAKIIQALQSCSSDETIME